MCENQPVPGETHPQAPVLATGECVPVSPGFVLEQLLDTPPDVAFGDDYLYDLVLDESGVVHVRIRVALYGEPFRYLSNAGGFWADDQQGAALAWPSEEVPVNELITGEGERHVAFQVDGMVESVAYARGAKGGPLSHQLVHVAGPENLRRAATLNEKICQPMIGRGPGGDPAIVFCTSHGLRLATMQPSGWQSTLLSTDNCHGKWLSPIDFTSPYELKVPRLRTAFDAAGLPFVLYRTGEGQVRLLRPGVCADPANRVDAGIAVDGGVAVDGVIAVDAGI